MKNSKQYIDSLVNRLLKETLEDKANEVMEKLNFRPGKSFDYVQEGEVCECGSPMIEGECMECGNMTGEVMEKLYGKQSRLDKNKNGKLDSEDFKMLGRKKETKEGKSQECMECGSSEIYEGECMECGYTSGEVMEKLYGRQSNLDKNKNGRLDSEDFKMLRRKKSEMSEDECTECGDKWEMGESKNRFIQKATSKMEKKGTEHKFGSWCVKNNLDDDGEVTMKCINKALKSDNPSVVKMANFAKNIGGYHGAKHKKQVEETVYRLVDGPNSELFTESEIIDIIENIVKEEKNKEGNIKKGASPRGYSEYEKSHKGSGKESKEYLDSVAKKMVDYLKDGSKGKYETNPKHFPKGNGQLEKMEKKAYEVSNDGDEFIDDYLRPGMQTLDYDEMHPNEDWMKDNIEGSSRTGNNQEWGNAETTEVNKKINKTRKKNAYNKAKRAAYNKAPQPVISDKPGQESGKGLHIKTESVNEKQTQKLNEEFNRMKGLIGYNRKTQ